MDRIAATPVSPIAGTSWARWMVSRLRAMSLPEMGFRAGRKVRSSLELAGVGLARAPAATGSSGRPWVAALPFDFDTPRYLARADRVLSGRYDVFALEDARIGFPPRWNVDPKTGIETPLTFGNRLNYRDGSVAGDVKYLWEINRHLELVTLAQAWHLSRDERYAQGCRTLLESWFAQCPYPRGLNWSASLEPAVRLVNWSFAWHLLGADDSLLFTGVAGQAFRDRWIASVYQHCHFIAGHPSRYSSANNHLLGEAAGLLVGALTWPLWPQTERWRRQAHAELSAEALRQTFADGVNKEQAMWYHHSVADILLVAGLVARANGFDFAPAYWARLEAMLEFIASVMDSGGHVPAFGDADDGMLVRLTPERRPDVFRSLLATGAVLFGRADLGEKAGALDDKSRWLLGDEADERFRTVVSFGEDRHRANGTSRTERPHSPAVPRAMPHAAFPEGGYFVLGEAFDTPGEVLIVADAGPLGYLAIAAHGHADALSFTLSAGGLPILVDPGTFSYYGEASWRRYFRGTSAHNTVTIDGTDQSSNRGSFLWLEHARATVESFDFPQSFSSPEAFGSSDRPQCLVASHDGYLRLADPVRHRRTWRYQSGSGRLVATRTPIRTRKLVVIDELTCSAVHTAEIHWQFAPECQVRTEGDTLIVERALAERRVRLRLRGPEGAALQVACGQEHPPLGWYSPSFDVKVPAPAAVYTQTILGDTRLTTEIDIEFLSTRARRAGASAA